MDSFPFPVVPLQILCAIRYPVVVILFRALPRNREGNIVPFAKAALSF